jgi:pyruvate formate lyase activating enzyme
MIFAGLQKTSLIDYPGKVSCVAFVSGCNLACPYCHNPELAKGLYPERIAADALLEYLTPRKRLLDGVVISGGEPTLASELPDMCHAIQGLGLPVKLDTNGTRPDVLQHLLAHQLVDYVAMDIKTSLNQYAPLLTTEATARQVARSIRLIMESDVDYEFRTTCLRPFVDEKIVVEIARGIQGARRYVLQAFRSSVLLDPKFFSAGDPGFSAKSMQLLRQSVVPWVADTQVRGVAGD